MNNSYDVECRHDCGDYLNNYMLRGRQFNDAVFCRCNKIWKLLPETWWRYWVFWRVRDSYLENALWWRDRAAEKARDAAQAVR